MVLTTHARLVPRLTKKSKRRTSTFPKRSSRPVIGWNLHFTLLYNCLHSAGMVILDRRDQQYFRVYKYVDTFTIEFYRMYRISGSSKTRILF